MLAPVGLKLVQKGSAPHEGQGKIVINLLESNISPLEVLTFRSDHRVQYLISIPVNKVRGSRLLDTWVEVMQLMAKECSDQPVEQRSSFVRLKKYFDENQPRTVAERLGLTAAPISAAQSSYLNSPPLYAIFPWEAQLPDERYRAALKGIKMEFEDNSSFTYEPSDGWKGWGPASQRLITVEHQRLANIYHLIAENGFQGRHGKLEATIYRRGQEFMAGLGRSDGWHRIAALAALGFPSIPFALDSQSVMIVDKADAKSWPHVQSGLFTLTQAKELFDKSFVPFTSTSHN